MQPDPIPPFDQSDIHDGIGVADGHGIRIRVDRRHLVVDDGIGSSRRSRRFHKTDRHLNRLVVIGGTGYVSLDAYRWLADVGIPLIHLDREGRLLAVAGTLEADKPALRRAQALASSDGTGVEVMRWLLATKIERQAAVVSEHFQADPTPIIDCISRLDDADTPDALRPIEGEAAANYWAAWNSVEPSFVRRDRTRVPERWLRFDTRSSPVTGSARKAADPVNAILNYLYALVEAECRIACLTVGLDPGIGVMHADQWSRDSMALDVIEPVRPQIDRWLLKLLDSHVFRATDFNEDRRGVCRITPVLSHRLAETLPMIRQEVGPIVESAARLIVEHTDVRVGNMATVLTQSNRSRSRPQGSRSRTIRPTRLPSVCPECGDSKLRERKFCDRCAEIHQQEKSERLQAAGHRALAERRRAGTDPAHGGRVGHKRGKATRDQNEASREWDQMNARPDDAVFTDEILPYLGDLTVRSIAQATGLSTTYASMIRRGLKVPHPRHWSALLGLVSDERSLRLE